MIFEWILLIIGFLCLLLFISSLKEFTKLDNELTYGDARKVSYWDYLINGYCTFLGLPASIFWVGACIYLLVIEYFC